MLNLFCSLHAASWLKLVSLLYLSWITARIRIIPEFLLWVY